MGLFDKFKKDDHISFLKKNINDKMSLSDIVGVFEKMCARPIDNDMLLYETGTTESSGETYFFINLVRQFPNEDEEYYQIHVDIMYKPDSGNQGFQAAVWNEDIEGDFFDYIRSSKAFEYSSSAEIEKINIIMDET